MERYGILKSDLELVHPEDRATVKEVYERDDAELEYRILQQDGSMRHVKEIIQDILDKEEKMLASVATTLQDIRPIDGDSLIGPEGNESKAVRVSREQTAGNEQ